MNALFVAVCYFQGLPHALTLTGPEWHSSCGLFVGFLAGLGLKVKAGLNTISFVILSIAEPEFKQTKGLIPPRREGRISHFMPRSWLPGPLALLLTVTRNSQAVYRLGSRPNLTGSPFYESTLRAYRNTGGQNGPMVPMSPPPDLHPPNW
jgi:hypothetical protein